MWITHVLKCINIYKFGICKLFMLRLEISSKLSIYVCVCKHFSGFISLELFRECNLLHLNFGIYYGYCCQLRTWNVRELWKLFIIHDILSTVHNKEALDCIQMTPMPDCWQKEVVSTSNNKRTYKHNHILKQYLRNVKVKVILCQIIRET